MTAVSQARSAAQRAKHSTALEMLTRFGFIGFGVTHILLAWLALQIAYGRSTGATDQYGAFQTLVGQPFGRTLLVLLAIGLAAMALWQALEAAIGHRAETGRERVAERVVSVGRAVFYAYLVYTAYKVISHAPKTSAGQQEQTTASLLAKPGGQWIVALIGLAVLGVSIGLIWYGLVRRFMKHLRTGEMSGPVRTLICRLGVFGYAAKGVAYGAVGVLLLVAAARFDPRQSRGLDAALRTLAAQPWGDVLLTVVAAGIAAYGAFSLGQARYRKV
jgi:hypothetical protein